MFCQREDKTHKNHHLAAINAINSRSKTNSPYFIQKIRSQDVRSVYGAYKGNLTTRKLDKGNPEQTSQTIIVVLNNDGNKSINKELHNTVLSNS